MENCRLVRVWILQIWIGFVDNSMLFYLVFPVFLYFLFILLRGRFAKLRLSLYADATIIFLNPVLGEVTTLFNILEQFGNAS